MQYYFLFSTWTPSVYDPLIDVLLFADLFHKNKRYEKHRILLFFYNYKTLFLIFLLY